MKRNGFTLIELLAVIVILAIIALIATPIILGIINDARKESQERSIELYASAVRNGIAAYQLREGKEVSAGAYTSETLPFDVEYDGDVECTTIDIYDNGGLYVTGCTVNDTEVEYTYGTKQIIKGKLSSVCTPAKEQYFADSQLEAGYKYECEVADGVIQTFYVLTSTEEGATSVNLIMDSNVNMNGNAVKGEVVNSNGVAWIIKDDYVSKEIGGTEEEWNAGNAGGGNYANNNKGPITAMNYLQTATANWTNVNSQTISTFTDDNGHTHSMGKSYIVNARMPYYNEVSSYSASVNNAYLYDNLHFACWDEVHIEEIACSESTNIEGFDVEGIEHARDVNGYWLLSSNASYSYNAWCVTYDGVAIYDFVSNAWVGVRPVINLTI